MPSTFPDDEQLSTVVEPSMNPIRLPPYPAVVVTFTLEEQLVTLDVPLTIPAMPPAPHSVELTEPETVTFSTVPLFITLASIP